jgi:hypothetical protein
LRATLQPGRRHAVEDMRGCNLGEAKPYYIA